MERSGHDLVHIAVLAFSWRDWQKCKDLCLDSQLLSQDLNLESPVYEAGVLCTEPWRSLETRQTLAVLELLS
jgi:hypothetical protein